MRLVHYSTVIEEKHSIVQWSTTRKYLFKIHVTNAPEFMNIDDRAMVWGKLYAKEENTLISMLNLVYYFFLSYAQSDF
jgi:hypothetical protein